MTTSKTGDWRATRTAGVIRTCVSVIHHSIVVFVLLGWLLNDRTALLIHAALIPPIIVHWRFNKDRCIITNLENWLKYDAKSRPSVDSQEPFIANILVHIYRRPVTFRETQIWAHLLPIVAWVLGLYRLQEIGVVP